MTRHLIAAVLTGLLVLAPTAAFAQEEPPAETTEETSSWEALGEALNALLDTLTGAREELEGIEEDEDASDEDRTEAEEAFEALVTALTDAVAEVFANVTFAVMEAEALETAEELEDEGANGEAVSTLARCAPRGSFGAVIEGAMNHGEYVTAAAHGETVELAVPTITVTEPTEGEEGETTYTVDPAEEATAFDLTTTEGAEDLCAALDVIYQARLLDLELAWEDVDVSKDARHLVREQCQIQRLRERNGADVDAKEACAELRQKVRDMHAEERAEAKEARERARAEAKEAREAAKAERDAARAEARGARGNGRG